MRKSIFKRVTAAGVALMMLMALAPSMGLASQVYYTVTYNPNAPGSQAPRADSAAIGSLYNVRQNPFSNPGFTFNGWNTQANGSGEGSQPGQAIAVNGDQQLYAQWKPAHGGTATITYKANLGDNQADVTDTVNKGSAYTLRANPFAYPRTHTFIGWNTRANGSGNNYQASQILTASGSHTLYAQWKIFDTRTVTITYECGSLPDVKDTVAIGSAYTIKHYPYMYIQTLIFLGWSAQANGLSTLYSPGQVITANADLTLYPQFRTVSQTAAITYKVNLGSDQPDVTDIVDKGSSYTIRHNPFTVINPPPINYAFTGWNTQANGTGTSYLPNQVIIANAHLTLYGQWKLGGDMIADAPTSVDGRILPAVKAGDTSDWIEIARNGNYSLIVRKNCLKISPEVNNTLDSYLVTFGNTTAYSSSNVRRWVNAFFNSITIRSQIDSLPQNAKLRNYTVLSNAASVTGTCGYDKSLYDGFSKPTAIKVDIGDDILFPLSFCEAANFIAVYKYMRYAYNPIQSAPAYAVINFNKLNLVAAPIWLRTPGDPPDMAAAIVPLQNGNNGLVYQNSINIPAVIHPAAWVDSAIFNSSVN